MKISEEERLAIVRAVESGAAHGFGNLMAHLASAWALKLIEGGVNEKAAIAATLGRTPYPLRMHRDLVERGEWDETGARYAMPVRKAKRIRAVTKRKTR